jgi:uncharacterized protein (DUF2141 family)
VLAAAVLGLHCPSPSAAADSKSGTLSVRVRGIENDSGQLVAKLFRRGDGVPKGKSYRLAKRRIHKRFVELQFRDVPYGTYALFVFHDENGNSTVDHNFLGIPTEPLGLSNGYEVSLLKGMPTFDDLKFAFSPKTKPVAIKVD